MAHPLMHKLQSGHWRVVDAPDDWDEETDGYPDHQSAKIFGTEAEAWADYMNRAKPEDQTGVDVAGWNRMIISTISS